MIPLDSLFLRENPLPGLFFGIETGSDPSESQFEASDFCVSWIGFGAGF